MANIRLIDGTADNQVLGVENPTENNAAANKNYVDFIAPYNLLQDTKAVFDQPTTIPSGIPTVLEGEVGNTRVTNSVTIARDSTGITGTITFHDDDLGFATDALTSTGYGPNNRVFIRARRDGFPEAMMLELDRVAAADINDTTAYPILGFYRRDSFGNPTNGVPSENLILGAGSWVLTEVVNPALSNAELEERINNVSNPAIIDSNGTPLLAADITQAELQGVLDVPSTGTLTSVINTKQDTLPANFVRQGTGTTVTGNNTTGYVVNATNTGPGGGATAFRELTDVDVDGIPRRSTALNAELSASDFTSGHFRSDTNFVTLTFADSDSAVRNAVAVNDIIGFSNDADGQVPQGLFRVTHIRDSGAGETSFDGTAIFGNGPGEFFRTQGGVNNPQNNPITFNFPANWSALNNVFLVDNFPTDDQVLVYDPTTDRVEGHTIQRAAGETGPYMIPTAERKQDTLPPNFITAGANITIATGGSLTNGYELSASVAPIILSATAQNVNPNTFLRSGGELYYYLGSTTISLVDEGQTASGATTFDPNNTSLYQHITDTGVAVYEEFTLASTSTNPTLTSTQGTSFNNDLIVELNGIALDNNDWNADSNGVITVTGEFNANECFTVRGVLNEISVDPAPTPTPATNTDSTAVQDLHSGLALERNIVTGGAWRDVSPFPYRFAINREYAALWDETTWTGQNYFGGSATAVVRTPSLTQFGNTGELPNHSVFTGSRTTVSGVTAFDSGAGARTFPIIAFDFDFRSFPPGHGVLFDYPLFTAGSSGLSFRYDNAGLHFTSPAHTPSSETHTERTYLNLIRGGTTGYQTVGYNGHTGRREIGSPIEYIITNDIFPDGSTNSIDLQIQINLTANGVPYPTTSGSDTHYQTITVTRANITGPGDVPITTGANSDGEFTITGYEAPGQNRNFTPRYTVTIRTDSNTGDRVLAINHLNGPQFGLGPTYTDRVSYERTVTTVLPSRAITTRIAGARGTSFSNGYNQVLLVFSQDGGGGLNVQTVANGVYQQPTSLGYSAGTQDIINGFSNNLLFNESDRFNISHLQIYSYVHQDDWQHYEVAQMYNGRNIYLGAFDNPSFNTARYVTNRLVDFEGSIIDGTVERTIRAHIVPDGLGSYRWQFDRIDNPEVVIGGADHGAWSNDVTYAMGDFVYHAFDADGNPSTTEPNLVYRSLENNNIGKEPGSGAGASAWRAEEINAQSSLPAIGLTFVDLPRPGIDVADYIVDRTNASDPTRDASINVSSVTVPASTIRNVVALTITPTDVQVGDRITVTYQDTATVSIDITPV